MSKDTATPEEMNELHAKVADTLSKEIDKGGKGLAAILNVARQFLKDNKIEADVSTNKPLKHLASVLPFAGEDKVGAKH